MIPCASTPYDQMMHVLFCGFARKFLEMTIGPEIPNWPMHRIIGFWMMMHLNITSEWQKITDDHRIWMFWNYLFVWCVMLKGVDIRRHDIPVFIGLDLTSLYHRFYSKKNIPFFKMTLCLIGFMMWYPVHNCTISTSYLM